MEQKLVKSGNEEFKNYLLMRSLKDLKISEDLYASLCESIEKILTVEVQKLIFENQAKILDKWDQEK